MAPRTGTMARRFEQHYLDAGDHTAQLGGGWYRESQRTARALSRKHGVSVACAAGVIAALSPRIFWNVNVRWADDALAGRPFGGFEANRAKARRIIAGERPLDVLGGPKVREFYRAMMGDNEATVIDVWMLRAAGWPEPFSSTFVPARHYERVAEALVQAALSIGVPPATLQAVVWTHVRGRHD